MALNSADEAVSTDEDFNPLSDPEERRVLYAALDSFRQYRTAAHYNITHLRRQSYYSLPSAHIDLLSDPPFSLPKTFDAVDDAIDSNADLADAILAVGLQAYGIDPTSEEWHDGKATPSDMDKARSTLRQCYRDWSAEGSSERNAAHGPILSALQAHLPHAAPSQRHRYRVLVPGAGLGRLLLDLCGAGYSVEGNEISYHQLLASNYLLNFTEGAGQHRLSPWALSFSNHLTRNNQLQAVSIPDIHPPAALDATRDASELHYSERMGMSSGDFCVVYRHAQYRDHFDAVTTCFFIDTAPNVIRYIETVRNCLRTGGVWVNIGPLLWHFESSPTPADRDRERRQASSAQHSHGSSSSTSVLRQPRSSDEGIGEPGSFELSNDEVIALIQRLGFEIVEHRQAGEQGYIQDPNSMLQNLYRPMFWVARKT